MRDLFQTIIDALKGAEPIALLTVTRSIGSTPRHAAAKMVVRPDGTWQGTIGGGTMEHKAIQDAVEALTANRPQLVEYPLIGRDAQSLGLCGGTQEIFIDVLAGATGPDPLPLFEALVNAYDRGEPAALITLVHTESGAGDLGQKALLRYDASLAGDLLPPALAPSQTALRENRPMRLGGPLAAHVFSPLDSLTRAPVELFVDVVQPRAELLIIGLGHIGLALAEFGRLLGLRVVVIDDRPEWLARCPQADQTILVAYDPASEALESIPVTITPSAHIVVATWGWDEPALAQVATSPAAYISLVASRRKASLIFEKLLDGGLAQEDLARIKVPAGLDLGAETPQEVAFSILAEILMTQRGASGRPMTEVRGHPLVRRRSRRVD